MKSIRIAFISLLCLLGALPLSAQPSNTIEGTVDLSSLRQRHEGWGVSLCWWANMCGKWDEEKVDELVDWLVSPNGLNFNIFRYNIGGGEDPLNRNCDLHHMGRGKGLRAEMEGFKDSTNGDYVWTRDLAQRRIMLKIKQKRPDAIFEAFSNSCPYYMTYSGCVGGNDDPNKDNLRPEYYEEFAHYLVDVCKHYKEVYGIEFKTLDPFNEPMTDYWNRNGSQEGCHFDFESQIAFLKVLSPILKASGLKTVISASDETEVATSVKGIKAYQEAGALDLVGQWNVHTYKADNESRKIVNQVARGAGKMLWMSEVGAGGRGIDGNLRLAQTLFDDERYIQPDAWIDWQYAAERDDQWCMIDCDFEKQTYRKVKHYSVRQQVSRFIKVGYTFVDTSLPSTLAAISPDKKQLVLVALNLSKESQRYSINLLNGKAQPTKGQGYITTRTQDVEPCHFQSENKRNLHFNMPAKSIMTIVVPIKTNK